MQTQKQTLDELMTAYAQSLGTYDLAYSTQLRLLQRAGIIVRQHVKNAQQ